MKTKTKSWIVLVAGVVVVLAALAGIKASQIFAMVKAGEAAAVPPEAVTSAKVEAAEWQTTRNAVGTLVAVRGVTLGAEAPGTVKKIGFESGASVKEGAVLVELDAAAEKAELAAAVAESSLAILDRERARALRRAGANAEAELDAAEARAAQASAAEARLRAAMAKKTIRAPFDGRIAIRQVELGQVVAPGTPVASLQSVHPIHADFWLPQHALAHVRAGERARLRTDVAASELWEGEVTTINPEVDPATRNVRVRATFPNHDGRLRPGMYAEIELLSADERRVLVIPATAVVFAPYGDSVFVLEKDDKADGGLVARQRFVHLGERRGDFVAVDAGLVAGELVASSGAFKLQSGASVIVNDALSPDAGLAPRPLEP